eukprot:234609-Prymnesium_polylepis.1
MGGVRSWGGCLDPLIITYSLGIRDLRGFDREVMSEVDRELMGLCHGYVYVRVGWGESRKSKRDTR